MSEDGCHDATRIIVLTFLIGLNNCADNEMERSKYFSKNLMNQERPKEDRLQHQTPKLLIGHLSVEIRFTGFYRQFFFCCSFGVIFKLSFCRNILFVDQ